MNKMFFPAFLVVSTLSAFTPASAQVSAGISSNVNLQAIDTSRVQGILCQVRPSKACIYNGGGKRTQPGTQRNPGQDAGRQQVGNRRQ